MFQKPANIYEHIAANNTKIWALVALFPVALCTFIYAWFWLYSLTINDPIDRTEFMALFSYTVPWIFGLCLVLTLLSLWGGDKMMMSFAGAKPCPQTGEYRKVYQAVENVALAAGLPTPKVYLISDDSLNAFATGYAPKSASIALTTGIINKLTPLELDGVIAHEMAHIKNRDIRLNMYIITGIGVIAMIGDILIRFSHGGRSRNDKNNAAVFFLLLGFALILFRFFVAPFIHMAISRKQEFQADATGAYFTRNPQALASALKKIAQDPLVESLDGAQQMAAACIYNPLKQVSGLLDTHPPVAQRIQRLNNM